MQKKTLNYLCPDTLEAGESNTKRLQCNCEFSLVEDKRIAGVPGGNGSDVSKIGGLAVMYTYTPLNR